MNVFACCAYRLSACCNYTVSVGADTSITAYRSQFRQRHTHDYRARLVSVNLNIAFKHLRFSFFAFAIYYCFVSFDCSSVFHVANRRVFVMV